MDGSGKSHKSTTNVIPAEAGIQTSSRRKPETSKALDPGFRRGDDFYDVVTLDRFEN